MTKVINYTLSIDTSEQQCFVLKGMLQSPRPKYHMNNIGIDQSLRNRASFEHTFLNNIKKIYQNAGKCDDQQKFKDIIEAAMVSTPEEINDDIPSLTMTQTTVKKPSARKSLHLSTNIFDVKKRTAIRRVGAAKSKQKPIKAGSSFVKKK